MMKPTQRSTALLTASALLLAGVVSFALFPASESASAADAASVGGKPASLSMRDALPGSFYPKLKSWAAYDVMLNLTSSSGPQRFAAGELVVMVQLPGPVSSVAPYSGWEVSLKPGASTFTLTNSQAVEIPSLSSLFFAADAFGSYPRGGVATMTLNNPGLSVRSDTAPQIL